MGKGPTVIERANTHLLDILRDKPARGRIIRNLCRIDQNVISTIFSYLANYGFTTWNPDLTQPPQSLWNVACENVAIDSFKQAMMSHAYAFLSPNHEYASNTAILQNFYKQFVWTHIKNLFDTEAKATGTVAEKALMNEVYRRRQKVRDICFCSKCCTHKVNCTPTDRKRARRVRTQGGLSVPRLPHPGQCQLYFRRRKG